MPARKSSLRRRAVSKKAQAATSTATEPAGAKKSVVDFLESLHPFEVGSKGYRMVVLQKFAEIFPDEEVPDVHPKLLATRVGYELIWLGYQQANALSELHPKVIARRLASTRYKAAAFDERLRFYLDLAINKKEDDMPKTVKKKAAKKSKPATEKRKSISARMIELLGQSNMPTNEALTKQVQDEFPASRFSGTHLSWYKSQFRRGLLSGMAKGKARTIAGENKTAAPAEPKKKKASKKTASKKAASKKKTAKKKKA